MSPAEPDPWMPNGFPPPSFVVETERTGRFSQLLGGPRNRWLAAAALLGAVLLLAGILLIANRDDEDDTALRSGASSTTFAAGSDTTETSVLDPTAALPEAGTLPPGDPGAGATAPAAPAGGTTVPAAPASPPPAAPAATPAKLEVSSTTLAIPRVDGSVGPQSAKLGLRNAGGAALSYSSRSNTGALSIDPPSGSIPAGGATEVTVSLDANKAGEGGFRGMISIDGTGGSQPVTVTSTVGRPPDITDAGQTCPPDGTDCSSQMALAPTRPDQTTPCNSPWYFRVNVTDESTLKTVRVNANLGQFGGGLLKDGATIGTSGIWESRRPVFDPLPAGEFKFTIEAIDQFDYTRKASERTVRCP